MQVHMDLNIDHYNQVSLKLSSLMQVGAGSLALQ